MFPDDGPHTKGGNTQATHLGQAPALHPRQAPFFRTAAPTLPVSLRPGHCENLFACACQGSKATLFTSPPPLPCPLPRFPSPLLYPLPPLGASAVGLDMDSFRCGGPRALGRRALRVLGIRDGQGQHREVQRKQMLAVVSAKLKCILPAPPSSIYRQRPPPRVPSVRSRVSLQNPL